MNRTAAREQMPCRLIKFEENYKFRDYWSKRGDSAKGMGAFVGDLKEEFRSVEHVVKPRLSEGLETTMKDLAVDKIVNNRVGLVPPEKVHDMYEGLHSHLESVGIDGVKVDVIHFHAASRTISGGPIYVSDSIGQHDFNLLKRPVLPDGSILRCRYYALRTRDCLFEDPLHDGKTMLKIWNVNKYTGVLGVFNCQRGGWCPKYRRNKSASEFSRIVSCYASPKDIEWNNPKNPMPVRGADVFAVYMFREKKLKLLKSSESVEISLEPFNYELLTALPGTVLPRRSVQFAPIGLANVLNSAEQFNCWASRRTH
ncbi:hypothetical protein NL676_003293 [Syzygium grande]|nr:hypothetical protein NL676_003293 [Syzygium grande]